MDFYKAYAQNIPLPEPNSSAQEKVSKLTRKLIGNINIYSKAKEKQTDSVNELNKAIQEIQTEINEIIYDMYHITENEKKVIEESLK
jgi:vacuolar-type H+-ATPase subunit I/STV1